MELGQVLGFTPPPPPAPKDAQRSGGFAQAAAPYPYPSPFLDQQKMLSFSKAAAAPPPSSGMDFGRSNEQRLLLAARSKMPFTPSQWMELEHQALIYKYLNEKTPIPSSLLISISKSFRSSSDRMTWRPAYQGFTNADSDDEEEPEVQMVGSVVAAVEGDKEIPIDVEKLPDVKEAAATVKEEVQDEEELLSEKKCHKRKKSPIPVKVRRSERLKKMQD